MCGTNITNNQYQMNRGNDTNNSKEINSDKKKHMRNLFTQLGQNNLLWKREQLFVTLESNK
jgi:hypothetical protein